MFNLVKMILGVMFGVLGIYYLIGYLIMFSSNLGFNSFLSGASIALGLLTLAYGAFYFINSNKIEPEFDIEVQTKLTFVPNSLGDSDLEIVPDLDFGNEPKMKDITPPNSVGSKTIH
ncbi:MAG: hypothetical protein ACKVIX_03485 [Sphingomonadales bacterium]|jgi:hypothetical protein